MDNVSFNRGAKQKGFDDGRESPPSLPMRPMGNGWPEDEEVNMARNQESNNEWKSASAFPAFFSPQPLPIVEISPPDIARRPTGELGGAIQADKRKEITRRETFEDGFSRNGRHLLIALRNARERPDGRDANRRACQGSTLGAEFNCKLSFGPWPGNRFYGWQTPRVLMAPLLTSISICRIGLFDRRLRRRPCPPISPRPVLLRSSRLGNRAQAQGRGREIPNPWEGRELCGRP